MNKTESLIVSLIGISVFTFTGGCSVDTIDTEKEMTDTNFRQEMESQLVDDNGNPYTLVKNSDGTETATFEDGSSITFKRDFNGELELVEVMTSNETENDDEAIAFGLGLLSGIATSYFLLNGYNAQQGYLSGNKYILKDKPSYVSDINHRRDLLSNYANNHKEKQNTGSSVVPFVSSNSTNHNSSSSASINSTSNNKTTSPNIVSKPSVNAKGGFGSVGVRSAVS